MLSWGPRVLGSGGGSMAEARKAGDAFSSAGSLVAAETVHPG